MIKRFLNLSDCTLRISAIYCQKCLLQLSNLKGQDLFMANTTPISSGESDIENTVDVIHGNSQTNNLYYYSYYPFPNWHTSCIRYNNFLFPVSLSSFISNQVMFPPNTQFCYYSSQNNCGEGSYVRQRSQGVNMSLRIWEYLEPNTNQPGFIFTLMSYNVLAQDLLQDHPYLYRNHNPISLEWKPRWKSLLREIKRINPDIICLQEVQESHIKDYFSVLDTLGYNSIYKKRTGFRTDGCAIYYKHSLRLIDHKAVEFLRPNVKLLNRDNIGLIAKFAPRFHQTKEFVVATTHLLYNPRRDDVRLAQMQLFFADIAGLSLKTKLGNISHVPIIITGDLNSQPYSDLYNAIILGKLINTQLVSSTLNDLDSSTCGASLWMSEFLSTSSSVKKDFLTKNLSLKSVYNHGAMEHAEGTTFQEKWVTVDYIFFSSSKDIQKTVDDLRLLSRLRLPTAEELQDMFIPNREFGSDHFSLVAKFKLKF